MAFCALRVLKFQGTYDPKVTDQIYTYYRKFWRSKLADNIDKYFDINLNGWFNHLDDKMKPHFVRFMEINADADKYRRRETLESPGYSDNRYEAFIKQETQAVGDKARQIGNPSIAHKYTVGPSTKAIEYIFKKTFGAMFDIGKSYEDKEKELNELLKSNHYNKFVTLDLSGFDQSHNTGIKQIWRDFCQMIVDRKESIIDKWTTKENFLRFTCPTYTTVVYKTKVPIDFHRPDKKYFDPSKTYLAN